MEVKMYVSWIDSSLVCAEENIQLRPSGIVKLASCILEEGVEVSVIWEKGKCHQCGTSR